MSLALTFAVMDALAGTYLLLYALRRRERKRPQAVVAVGGLLLVVAAVLAGVVWQVAHRQQHCQTQTGQRVACTSYSAT